MQAEQQEIKIYRYGMVASIDPPLKRTNLRVTLASTQE